MYEYVALVGGGYILLRPEVKIKRLALFCVATLTLGGVVLNLISKVRVLLQGDEANKGLRFIKIIGVSGSDLLFAQNFSCDAKDCHPMRESIKEMASADRVRLPLGNVELRRRNNYRSEIIWLRDGLPLGRPV